MTRGLAKRRSSDVVEEPDGRAKRITRVSLHTRAHMAPSVLPSRDVVTQDPAVKVGTSGPGSCASSRRRSSRLLLKCGNLETSTSSQPSAANSVTSAPASHGHRQESCDVANALNVARPPSKGQGSRAVAESSSVAAYVKANPKEMLVKSEAESTAVFKEHPFGIYASDVLSHLCRLEQARSSPIADAFGCGHLSRGS